MSDHRGRVRPPLPAGYCHACHREWWGDGVCASCRQSSEWHGAVYAAWCFVVVTVAVLVAAVARAAL